MFPIRQKYLGTAKTNFNQKTLYLFAVRISLTDLNWWYLIVMSILYRSWKLKIITLCLISFHKKPFCFGII